MYSCTKIFIFGYLTAVLNIKEHNYFLPCSTLKNCLRRNSKIVLLPKDFETDVMRKGV